VRRTPQVGDLLETPTGKQSIVSIDLARDMVMCDSGAKYREEDLVDPLPPSDRKPDDIEAWLDQSWLVVIARNDPCTCGCAHCNMMTIQRGSITPVVTHQRQSGACQCSLTGFSCCA
jgi:hypothetical protein